MSANERKRAQRKSAEGRKRAHKSTKESKRALPPKKCKQPGLKQPGSGIPKQYCVTVIVSNFSVISKKGGGRIYCDFQDESINLDIAVRAKQTKCGTPRPFWKSSMPSKHLGGGGVLSCGAEVSWETFWEKLNGARRRGLRSPIWRYVPRSWQLLA